MSHIETRPPEGCQYDRIDDRGADYLYEQVAGILTARIERGDWQPRRLFPSGTHLRFLATSANQGPPHMPEALSQVSDVKRSESRWFAHISSSDP